MGLVSAYAGPRHLIRQCFDRPDARDLGELLIDLEEDDFVRRPWWRRSGTLLKDD